MGLHLSRLRTVCLATLLFLGGCGWLTATPQPVLPAEELYRLGEQDLARSRYEDARSRFKDIVARHPDSSYAPRARFLIGETYFREGEFDKAVKEFEAFLAFYPQHQIADLVQYRLAVSYYDQMKPVEQDRSEEHTSELQSQSNLVCRLLLEKKKNRPGHPTSLAGRQVPARCQPAADA